MGAGGSTAASCSSLDINRVGGNDAAAIRHFYGRNKQTYHAAVDFVDGCAPPTHRYISRNKHRDISQQATKSTNKYHAPVASSARLVGDVARMKQYHSYYDLSNSQLFRADPQNPHPISAVPTPQSLVTSSSAASASAGTKPVSPVLHLNAGAKKSNAGVANRILHQRQQHLLQESRRFSDSLPSLNNIQPIVSNNTAHMDTGAAKCCGRDMGGRSYISGQNSGAKSSYLCGESSSPHSSNLVNLQNRRQNYYSRKVVPQNAAASRLQSSCMSPDPMLAIKRATSLSALHNIGSPVSLLCNTEAAAISPLMQQQCSRYSMSPSSPHQPNNKLLSARDVSNRKQRPESSAALARYNYAPADSSLSPTDRIAGRSKSPHHLHHHRTRLAEHSPKQQQKLPNPSQSNQQAPLTKRLFRLNHTQTSNLNGVQVSGKKYKPNKQQVQSSQQQQACRQVLPPLPRSRSLHELIQLRATENGQRMRTTGTLRGPLGQADGATGKVNLVVELLESRRKQRAEDANAATDVSSPQPKPSPKAVESSAQSPTTSSSASISADDGIASLTNEQRQSTGAPSASGVKQRVFKKQSAAPIAGRNKRSSQSRPLVDECHPAAAKTQQVGLKRSVSHSALDQSSAASAKVASGAQQADDAMLRNSYNVAADTSIDDGDESDDLNELARFLYQFKMRQLSRDKEASNESQQAPDKSPVGTNDANRVATSDSKKLDGQQQSPNSTTSSSGFASHASISSADESSPTSTGTSAGKLTSGRSALIGDSSNRLAPIGSTTKSKLSSSLLSIVEEYNAALQHQQQVDKAKKNCGTNNAQQVPVGRALSDHRSDMVSGEEKSNYDYDEYEDDDDDEAERLEKLKQYTQLRQISQSELALNHLANSATDLMDGCGRNNNNNNNNKSSRLLRQNGNGGRAALSSRASGLMNLIRRISDKSAPRVSTGESGAAAAGGRRKRLLSDVIHQSDAALTASGESRALSGLAGSSAIKRSNARQRNESNKLEAGGCKLNQFQCGRNLADLVDAAAADDADCRQSISIEPGVARRPKQVSNSKVNGFAGGFRMLRSGESLCDLNFDCDFELIKNCGATMADGGCKKTSADIATNSEPNQQRPVAATCCSQLVANDAANGSSSAKAATTTTSCSLLTKRAAAVEQAAARTGHQAAAIKPITTKMAQPTTKSSNNNWRLLPGANKSCNAAAAALAGQRKLSNNNDNNELCDATASGKQCHCGCDSNGRKVCPKSSQSTTTADIAALSSNSEPQGRRKWSVWLMSGSSGSSSSKCSSPSKNNKLAAARSSEALGTCCGRKLEVDTVSNEAGQLLDALDDSLKMRSRGQQAKLDNLARINQRPKWWHSNEDRISGESDAASSCSSFGDDYDDDYDKDELRNNVHANKLKAKTFEDISSDDAGDYESINKALIDATFDAKDITEQQRALNASPSDSFTFSAPSSRATSPPLPSCDLAAAPEAKWANGGQLFACKIASCSSRVCIGADRSNGIGSDTGVKAQVKQQCNSNGEQWLKSADHNATVALGRDLQAAGVDLDCDCSGGGTQVAARKQPILGRNAKTTSSTAASSCVDLKQQQRQQQVIQAATGRLCGETIAVEHSVSRNKSAAKTSVADLHDNGLRRAATAAPKALSEQLQLDHCRQRLHHRSRRRCCGVGCCEAKCNCDDDDDGGGGGGHAQPAGAYSNGSKCVPNELIIGKNDNGGSSNRCHCASAASMHADERHSTCSGTGTQDCGGRFSMLNRCERALVSQGSCGGDCGASSRGCAANGQSAKAVCHSSTSAPNNNKLTEACEPKANAALKQQQVVKAAATSGPNLSSFPSSRLAGKQTLDEAVKSSPAGRCCCAAPVLSAATCCAQQQVSAGSVSQRQQQRLRCKQVSAAAPDRYDDNFILKRKTPNAGLRTRC